MPPGGRLRLAGVSAPEVVGETTRAAGRAGLGYGAGMPQGCSRSQRLKALRSIEASRAYGTLARDFPVVLDMRRATFAADGRGEIVGVAAAGSREGVMVFGAFLVDLRRGALDSFRYTAVVASDEERVFTEHRDGEARQKLIVGDDYVILPDGAWVAPEEFMRLARGWEPMDDAIEYEASPGEEVRSACLRQSYHFCRGILDRYRASWRETGALDALGGAACDHLFRRSGGEAWCRAWARTRCYLGSPGGWPGT